MSDPASRSITLFTPNTTKLAPDPEPCGSSACAPMIRSSRPSPFTSPALLTDPPALSPAEAPYSTKPPVPAFTADSSTAVVLSLLPNTTKLAPESEPFGLSKGAPTIRSSRPSAFTSPALLTDQPDRSPAPTPLMTKPPMPASTADSSTAVLLLLPNTTKLAPEEIPFGSSKGAPTIRSSRPSPFTSPALLTEWPDWSLADTPLMTKPPMPASTADRSAAVPSLLPNTTKLAPDAPPFGSSPDAPTIRSSMPSPLTSPALLTEWPDSSNAPTPLMTKPPVPASTTDKSTAVRSLLPNTTKLAPETEPFGSAWGAPMIRSPRPSPLTSPAALTDQPAWSAHEAPLMTKPPFPFATLTRSTAAVPSLLPNTT